MSILFYDLDIGILAACGAQKLIGPICSDEPLQGKIQPNATCTYYSPKGNRTHENLIPSSHQVYCIICATGTVSGRESVESEEEESSRRGVLMFFSLH